MIKVKLKTPVAISRLAKIWASIQYQAAKVEMQPIVLLITDTPNIPSRTTSRYASPEERYAQVTCTILTEPDEL